MISAVIDTKAFGKMVQEFRAGPGRDYSQADLARYVSDSLVDDSPYLLRGARRLAGRTA